VQGGSSLTQQLAKNLFLSSERSLERKIKSCSSRSWLESRFTKREILEALPRPCLMAVVPFGVEAAAQFLFRKVGARGEPRRGGPPRRLVQGATKYAPHINLPAARARTNEVLQNLVEAGFYTAAEVHEARLNPAKIVDTRSTDSPDWFLDYAFEEVQRVAEGKGQYVLSARTTIDLSLQKAADDAIVPFIRQRAAACGSTPARSSPWRQTGRYAPWSAGAGLRRKPVQPRDARAPPARFLVQGLCLCDRARARLQARDESCRRQVALVRPLEPVELRRRRGSGLCRMPLWMALAKSLKHRGGRTVVRRRARERDRDDEAPRHQGHPQELLRMALGDYGITPLEHTAVSRPSPTAASQARPYADPRALQFKRRTSFITATRDEPAPAADCSSRKSRPAHEPDDEQGRHRRNRPA